MVNKNRTKTLIAGFVISALFSSSPGYAQGKGSDGRNGKSNSVEVDRNEVSTSNRDKADRGGQADAVRGRNDQEVRRGSGREDETRSEQGSGNPTKGNQRFGDNMRDVTDRKSVGFDRNDGANGFAFRELRETIGSRPRLIDGCPPGLAKKRNGCLPPGQAKNRYRSFEPRFFGLNGAENGRYFYQDGYLLQYRPDGLAGFLPLLGGALGIGNIWPASYAPEPLPNYYSDYFQLGDQDSYRFADNVIYRVNPDTAAITSVAGLLTGNTFDIGSPMPRGYDVYNVPFDQREQYSDSPDARYRYADGYVYKIDPVTSLVTSAIALVL
ncbi:hypothetical protein [uncultured Erythrobacter sp.]|uniref:hypothetical protein n=1 Tax=uncultured Erythrobacter sp. TaxID=263913 RepID=UPI00265A3333|nr:hypothetical protein [uncultured Erythrobacter sp.]